MRLRPGVGVPARSAGQYGAGCRYGRRADAELAAAAATAAPAPAAAATTAASLIEQAAEVRLAAGASHRHSYLGAIGLELHRGRQRRAWTGVVDAVSACRDRARNRGLATPARGVHGIAEECLDAGLRSWDCPASLRWMRRRRMIA